MLIIFSIKHLLIHFFHVFNLLFHQSYKCWISGSLDRLNNSINWDLIIHDCITLCRSYVTKPLEKIILSGGWTHHSWLDTEEEEIVRLDLHLFRLNAFGDQFGPGNKTRNSIVSDCFHIMTITEGKQNSYVVRWNIFDGFYTDKYILLLFISGSNICLKS